MVFNYIIRVEITNVIKFAFRATYRWEVWSLKAALDGYLNLCKVIQKFSTNTDKGYKNNNNNNKNDNYKTKPKNCDAALMRKRKTKTWFPTI